MYLAEEGNELFKTNLLAENPSAGLIILGYLVRRKTAAYKVPRRSGLERSY